MQTTPDVLYTTTYDAKAKQYLQEGKKVVLCPKPNKVKGRKSVFHNHFWNPIMFKWAPTTLGCLIHADQLHQIFMMGIDPYIPTIMNFVTNGQMYG